MVETLVSEEIIYYDILDTIVQLYEVPLRHALSKKPILSNKLINQIFGNTSDLHALSAELSTRLQTRMTEPWMVGDVFVQMAPFLKAYTPYVVACSQAVDTVNSSLENPEFMSFWRAASQLPASKGQMLQSLLVAPLNRIPRYRQILELLLESSSPDSSDYSDLHESITALKRISQHMHESRRENEATMRLVNLSKMLIVPADVTPPIHEGVRLLKQGLIMKSARVGYQVRALFLLSDRLLITLPTFPVDLPIPNESASEQEEVEFDLLKDTSIGNYTLLHNLAVDLVRASHEVAGEDLFDVGFQILTPEKSFDVFCQTTNQRNEWVDVINESAKERLDVVTDLPNDTSIRKRLELASFQAPVWIPDSQAPRCFICDKSFSTFVRRHHCRSCGRVVCFECGSRSVELPGIKTNRWERVCDICFEHRGGRLNPQSRASSFDESMSGHSVGASPKRFPSNTSSPRKEASSCQLCHRAFGWFVWKYHCEKCGKAVDFACWQTDKSLCEPCSQGLDPQFIQVSTNGWSFLPE